MQINKKHNFDILTQFEWMDTGHNYEYRSVMHYDAFDFAISKVRVAKISVRALCKFFFEKKACKNSMQ